MRAVDEDQFDQVLYSLTPSAEFAVDRVTGHISLTDPSLLTEDSYRLQVFAQDKAGNTGSPATINIVMEMGDMEIEDEYPVHTIVRRDLQREGRGFVVRSEVFGDLFSVAPIPPVEGEMYYFVEPAPENLTLDSVTGMVFRENDHVWSGLNETFMVNITLGEGKFVTCI